MTIPRRHVLSMLALGSAVAACGNPLTKPYPEKRLYRLDAARGEAAAPAANNLVLAVHRFDVSPGFQDRGLILRTDGVSAAQDFYNEFFVAPGEMISDLAAKWLGRAGLFQAVLQGPSRLASSHSLEGALNAIYGDVSTPGGPFAVLDLQLILLDTSTRPGRIVTQQDYRQRRKIASATPGALVEAWDAALQEILSDFEARIRVALKA